MASYESVFEDREHEYRTSGWLDALSIMRTIAAMESEEYTRKRPMYDTELVEFCGLIQAGVDVRNYANRNPTNSQNRNDALGRVGIASGRILTADFLDAYDAYLLPDWHEYLLKETDFGRLGPIIEELTDFYTPASSPKNDLSTFVERVKGSIEFYTGYYDPGF